MFAKDSIRFWRTTDKQEVDFVLSTSIKEGLALEAKVKCPDTNLPGKQKFMELYPGFKFRIISGEISKKCQWVMKL